MRPRAKAVLPAPEIACQADEVARLKPRRLRHGDGASHRLIRRLDAPDACVVPDVHETAHVPYWTDCVLGGAMTCGIGADAATGSTGKMQVTVVPSLGAVSIRTRP